MGMSSTINVGQESESCRQRVLQLEEALTDLYDLINDRGHGVSRELRWRLVHVTGLLEQCLLEDASSPAAATPALPFDTDRR